MLLREEVMDAIFNGGRRAGVLSLLAAIERR